MRVRRIFRLCSPQPSTYFVTGPLTVPSYWDHEIDEVPHYRDGPLRAQPIAGEEVGEARTAAVVARTVDVIIAARNRSDTIERAILSALTAPEVRHVFVVDDGPTDETAARARQCNANSGRVIVEHLRTNLGPSAALNVALRISTAPWVTILDGD